MPDSKLQQVISGALARLAKADSRSVNLPEVLQTLAPQGGSTLTEVMADVSKQLSGLSSVSQTQSEVISANTQAVVQNTTAHSSGGVKGAVSTIGSIASSVFGSGLGLAPLIAGLVHLFGGGKSEPPPALIRFSLPPSIRVDAANAPLFGSSTLGAGGLPAADYGQSGLPRIVLPSTEPRGEIERVRPPQITIQVQTMDSRSFLDHSQEIAQAVREAMLNMHSLNDVVSDL